jgi:hypothetical protein
MMAKLEDDRMTIYVDIKPRVKWGNSWLVFALAAVGLLQLATWVTDALWCWPGWSTWCQ